MTHIIILTTLLVILNCYVLSVDTWYFLRAVVTVQFNIDDATTSFRKMLTWRKEQNVDAYFEKVKAVNFDIHKVPYADVFEPYLSGL